MHILIGICLALALLYFWLIGHWFARVVVFLLLGCIGAVGGVALVQQYDGPSASGVSFVLGAAPGVALAWFVSGLPTYYRRRALGAPFTPSRLHTLAYKTRKLWRQIIGPDPDHPTPSFWPPEAHAFKPSVREGFVFGLCVGLAPIIVFFIVALGVALGQH